MKIPSNVAPAASLASLVMLAVPFISSCTTMKSGSADRAGRFDAVAGDWYEVGRTCDACDGGDAVRFAGKDGDVLVGANESKFIELKAFTNELTWYCGGSRERCANDVPFNAVRCERAGNGAIKWIFYAK